MPLEPIDDLTPDDFYAVHALGINAHDLYARELRDPPPGLSGDLNACAAPQYVEKSAAADRGARPHKELTLGVRSKQ